LNCWSFEGLYFLVFFCSPCRYDMLSPMLLIG
jgi:hypothetical protein